MSDCLRHRGNAELCRSFSSGLLSHSSFSGHSRYSRSHILCRTCTRNHCCSAFQHTPHIAGSTDKQHPTVPLGNALHAVWCRNRSCHMGILAQKGKLPYKPNNYVTLPAAHCVCICICLQRNWRTGRNSKQNFFQRCTKQVSYRIFCPCIHGRKPRTVRFMCHCTNSNNPAGSRHLHFRRVWIVQDCKTQVKTCTIFYPPPTLHTAQI